MKVTNNAELITLLNGMLPAVRIKAVMEGLQAGAKLINDQARTSLNASKRNSPNAKYAYYATAFKMEALKSKTANELGIRTGVYDKKDGYKLRWIEWGTAERETFERKSRTTNTLIPKMNRGSIIGYNFFFGAVRSQEDKVFKVVSEAVIKSLENLTK